MSVVKSARGPNFTSADRLLLIKFANKYKSIIESKKTDAVSWREKECVWRKLGQEFNASSEGAPRSVRQLKDKYKAIKKDLRKQHSDHMTYVRGTGGGPYLPPPSPKNYEEKKLIETIKLSIEGMKNLGDCDGRTGIIGILPESISCQETIMEDGNNNESIEAETVEVDWTSPSCSLWQTPKDSRLAERSTKKGNSSKEVETPSGVDQQLQCDDSSGMRIEDACEKVVPNKETVPVAEKLERTWTSRRRPTIKKRKTVSSTGAKFELVAEKKLELIHYQIMVAKNKLKQDEMEHDLKMEILQIKKSNETLKTEALTKGTMILDL